MFGIWMLLEKLFYVNILWERDSLNCIGTRKCWRWCSVKFPKHHNYIHSVKTTRIRKWRERETNCSMALYQTGSALAKPLTSFLVFVSKSPFMNDIVASPEILQAMTFFYLETRKQQINSVQPHLVEQCIGIFV
jgi:hypothetical protein